MTSVTTELGGRPLGESLFDPICDLYAGTFSVPPFTWDDHEAQRQRDSLRRLLSDPTFALAVAVARDGDGLVGFVYGAQVPAHTRCWQGSVTPLAPEVAAEWQGRTFAVADMAVRDDRRGHGIGRRLLETLLASRDEERATLTVEPTAEATQGFYRHLGLAACGAQTHERRLHHPVL